MSLESRARKGANRCTAVSEIQNEQLGPSRRLLDVHMFMCCCTRHDDLRSEVYTLTLTLCRKLLPHLLSQPDPAIGFDDEP